MKKSLIYILPAAFLLGLSLSCTKQEITDAASDGEEQIITARVNIATKVLYSEVSETNRNAGLKSVWEKGDYFYAIQDDSKVVQFTITSDNYAGKTYAVFSTKTSGVTESTIWKAVLGEGASAKGTTISCEYMGQNGMLDGLGRFNYVIAESTGTEPSFDFDNGTKLSHILRIKLPAGVKCIEYTPCAFQEVTATGTTLRTYSEGNSGQEPNYKSFSAEKTTTITLPAASAQGDCIYLAIPPVNCNLRYESYNGGKQYGNLRTGIILTFLNDTSDNADQSNGVVLGGDKDVDFDFTGKEGIIATYDYSALALISRPKPSDAILITTGATSTTKTDNSSVFSSSKQAVNGLETYWAPFNVGASTMTESGYYVGYGEMNQRLKGDFASYTLRQPGSDGTNRPAVICYTHAAFGGSGSTTFFTIAGTRYDIARVKWGIAWRMPYLIEGWTLWRDHKSNMSTPTVSGKKCIKVDNGSGQSLYLPCCGWYSDDSGYPIHDAGYTCLWTADKNQRSASNGGWDQAYAVQGTSTTQSDAFADRYGMHRSLNVRPVLASSVIQ